MLAPLITLSVLGFSAPESKLLALRGGVSTDVLYNSMAALNLGVGIQGWLSPKATMEMYGPKDISELESFCLRSLSNFNIVSGVR